MIANVQTLRVLFTFLVVTAHLQLVYGAIGLGDFSYALTHVSLDGFLTVSAYLIAYTQALRPRSAPQFLKRRLSRLIPFYWFVTLTVAALNLAVPSLFQHTVVTPETLLKSLFFIPYDKHDGVLEPIVFVGWTMNLFVFYVLVHALSLRLAGGKAWLATSFALIGLVVLGWITQPADPLLAFFTGDRLLPLAAGTLLGQWWRRVGLRAPASPLPSWFKPACYAVAITAFTLCSLRDVMFSGPSARIAGTLLSSALIVAVLLLDRAGAAHRSRIRDILAEASFAIYLTHYFATQAAAWMVGRMQPSNPFLVVLLLLAAYAAAAVLGILANRFIETPLEAVARGRWKRVKLAPRADTD